MGFVTFGLIVSGPRAVLAGLGDILVAPDVLITDFADLGGLGAAFAQAGLLTLIACASYVLLGATVDGGAVGCLYMVLGFGLFGKTLINVWPILAGVALYGLYQRQHPRELLTTAWFATALAPVFSEFAFNTALPRWTSIPLGLAIALVIGFAASPVAANLYRAHNGFTLYNMGFVAGVVGAVVVSVGSSFGLAPQPAMTWTSGHNRELYWLVGATLAAVVVTAFVADRRPWQGYLALHRRTGQAPADFIKSDGAGPTLLNMAVVGLLATLAMIAIGVDFNGPVVGGIVSIIGFGACGKHSVNVIPVMAGVIIGALVKPLGLTDPSVVWAIMFGTCLAPIAGRFGPHWGVVAGFLHVSAAQVGGALTAGLNLYGNGFAAGLVAAVVSPVALVFARRRATDSPREPSSIPAS